MPFSIDFKGRSAVVVGGDKGIGLEISRGYALAGANVAVLYHSNEGAHDVAKQIVKDFSVKSKAFKVDTASRSDVFSVIEKIEADPDFANFGLIAINSGIAEDQPALEHTENDVERLLSVDFKGVLWAAQASAKIFLDKQRQDAAMVLTSSMSAHIVNRPQNQCLYNASKASVSHLGKSLACEWAPKIRVNMVSPGYTSSAITDHMDPKRKEFFNSLTPLGRMASALEIANCVIFLSSTQASFCTGTDLICDGGYTCY